MVFFDNFGGKARQRAIDARAIHDASLLNEIHVGGYYQEARAGAKSLGRINRICKSGFP
jgi:hypothetical protein